VPHPLLSKGADFGFASLVLSFGPATLQSLEDTKVLSKPVSNRAIIIAAACGFFATVLVALFIHLIGPSTGSTIDALVVICPAGLLTIPLKESMQDRAGFYGVWLFVALLNAGIYALIAAFIVGMLGGWPQN